MGIIDRCFSEFYYLRAPNRAKELREKQLLWFNGTAEECLEYHTDATAKGRKLPFSCCGKPNAQARYLAGPLDDPVILGMNETELAKRAMDSIEQAFGVVGTMDRLEETLALLERRYPSFFKGAVEILHSVRPEKVNSHPKPDDEVKARMGSYFAAEREVFRFAQRKFRAQLEACRILMR